jgi:exodeoxyribonuclease VII small subunit
MNDMPQSDSRQFEQLLSELQATVAQLEGSDLTLHESIAAYERCVELANACTAILDAAELRINQIKVESPRVREQPAIYSVDSLTARRLLLGDDDLADLLDDEE